MVTLWKLPGVSTTRIVILLFIPLKMIDEDVKELMKLTLLSKTVIFSKSCGCYLGTIIGNSKLVITG